jgi:alpha,alpha-trehalase
MEHTRPGAQNFLSIGPARGGARQADCRRAPTDFGAVGALVRIATCISGRVEVMVNCAPLFNYGTAGGTWSYQGDGYDVMTVAPLGDPKDFVASKVMCWVAAVRGADLAEERGDDKRAKQWRAGADEIKAEVLDKGVSSRGVFRQHYKTDDLDASLLLLPIMGFLPPDDERIRATVLAIADELTKDGLVLRYRVDGTDTGFEGEEGTFTICSFWLVTALAMIGETGRAHALCEKLLSFAGPLLLYAEEIDTTTGEHLGNFPQAFTHLALIEAVSMLIETEPRGRLASSG